MFEIFLSVSNIFVLLLECFIECFIVVLYYSDQPPRNLALKSTNMHYGIDKNYIIISENTGKLNNSSNISPVYLKIPVVAATKCGILRFLTQQAANEIQVHEKCIRKTVHITPFQLNCIILRPS